MKRYFNLSRFFLFLFLFFLTFGSLYSIKPDVLLSSPAAIPTPVISYPTGGVLVYTNSPTIYWYLNQYFPNAQYHVQVSHSAVFDETKIIFEMNSLTSQNVEVPNLTGGEIYSARVRVKDPVTNTYGPFSAPAAFRINMSNGSEPLVPVISYPTGGAIVYTVPVTIYWYLNGPGTNLKYHLLLSTKPDFTAVIFEQSGITDMSYTLNNLTPGQVYYVKVRSYTTDLHYSLFSGVASFRVNDAGGSTALIPTISWPTGGATVYSTTQTVFWYLSGYAPGENYNLQLSKDNFTSLDVNIENINETQYTLTNLKPGQLYNIRVRGRIGTTGQYTVFSTASFLVIGSNLYPVMPVVANPIKEVEIASQTAILSWYAPSEEQEGTSYDLEYSTKRDFTEPVSITGITGKSYELKGLSEGTQYFWRVRAVSSEGAPSEYSEEGSFIVSDLATSVAQKTGESVPKEYSLEQNYPNPFNPATTIEFSLVRDERANLTVYDMLGRAVRVLMDQELSAGSYKIGLNAAGFSSGVYIYRLSTPSVTITRKMLLQK